MQTCISQSPPITCRWSLTKVLKIISLCCKTNVLLDLLNSSYPTQPHSLIVKYYGIIKGSDFQDSAW